MTGLMATNKRLRLSFDASSEVVRRAVYVAAAMQGKTHSDVLNELIETHLARYLEMARQEIADDTPRPAARRRKSGD